MNAPIIHPGDIDEGPVRPSSSQAGVAAIRFSHPAPEIKVGDRRVWLSGHEIEVTRLVTSGQFAGEWEYRYVETGAPGIHSAIDLLSMTTPTPTDPSTGAVTDHAPAPSDDARPPRILGFNVVTIDPEGNPGAARLDGVVSRQRAQDELDELEPFMKGGWTSVLVELREVSR